MFQKIYKKLPFFRSHLFHHYHSPNIAMVLPTRGHFGYIFKNTIFVLNKLKNKFFPVSMGVFDVKWCEESKNVGPIALRRLVFEKLVVFWKQWLSGVCGKKQQNHFLHKAPNSSKSKRRRAWGPTFLDSSHHFTSITSYTNWKKKIFLIFWYKNDIFTTFDTMTLDT